MDKLIEMVKGIEEISWEIVEQILRMKFFGESKSINLISTYNVIYIKKIYIWRLLNRKNDFNNIILDPRKS